MVDIREEFIQQAMHLARNAEVLPGGVEELAIKLQHAHDTNTPLRVKPQRFSFLREEPSLSL